MFTISWKVHPSQDAHACLLKHHFQYFFFIHFLSFFKNNFSLWIAMSTSLPFQLTLSFNYWICQHTLISSHSGKERMFDVIIETIELDLPAFMGKLFSYAANPGLIIPAVLLMVWVNCALHLHSVLSVRFCRTSNLSFVLSLSNERMCFIVSAVWQFITSTQCLRPIRMPTTSWKRKCKW